MPDMLSTRLALAPGRSAKLDGPAGAGKTTLAADLAVCCAANLRHAWGGAVELAWGGNVLWVAGESHRAFPALLRRLAEGHGQRWCGGVADRIGAINNMCLTERDAEETLRSACDGRALAIYDSRTSLCPNLDHDKPEAAEPLAMLERVSAATGCVMLVLDHDGWDGPKGWKPRHARGSSAIADACDTIMAVTGTGERRNIVWRKCSLGARPDVLHLRVEYEGRDGPIRFALPMPEVQHAPVPVVPEPVPPAEHGRARQIAELAREGRLSANQIFQQVGGNRAKVLNQVSKLRSGGS